jgi:hypothetical protein
MNINKGMKSIAIVILSITLVVSFLLFANIRNLLLAAKPSTYLTYSSYALSLFLVFAILALFGLVELAFRKYDEMKQSYNELKTEKVHQEEEKEVEQVKTQESKLDVQSYVDRILPSEKIKSVQEYSGLVLSNIAKEFPIVQGVFYFYNKENNEYCSANEYAYFGEEKPKPFAEGVTLAGQVVKNRTLLNLSNIPEHYVCVASGLGKGSPNHLIIIPLMHENEVNGIIELASFKAFTKDHETIFNALSVEISKHIINLL